jgi:predicted Zn finger-like uncharacterized protein
VYTQCPECGTVFRVTAAVLRAAQGQVCCGVCDAVFDSLRFLTDEPDAGTLGPADAERAYTETMATVAELVASKRSNPDSSIDTAAELSRDAIALPRRGLAESIPAVPGGEPFEAMAAAMAEHAAVPEAAPVPEPAEAIAADAPPPPAPPEPADTPAGIDAPDERMAGDTALAGEEMPQLERADLSVVADADFEFSASDTELESVSIGAEHVSADPLDEPADPESVDDTREPITADDAAEAPEQVRLAPREPTLGEEPLDDSDTGAPIIDLAPADDAAAEAADADADAEPTADAELGIDLAPPPDTKPRHRPWLGTAAVGLCLMLLLQVLHFSREALAANDVTGPAISALYARLGAPIEPHWDLTTYDVRQWGAGSDSTPGALRLRASIVNRANRPQPYPLFRVTLLDRFGGRVARREFSAGEYLPAHQPPAGPLDAGARADVDLSFADPGSQAVGFELDVCLRRAGHLQCAADLKPATPE